MHPVIRECISALWIALGVLWLVSAFVAKPAARRQSWSSRLVQSGIASAGFILIFSRVARVGPLARTFVPDSPLVAWTGLALTCAGIALAAWARLIIGKNWSATVTVKQSHQLVRTGPYKVVRHPIYSGILLAILGTAIAFREVRGLAGLGFVFTGFWMKLCLEEQFMTEQFGEDYIRYKQETQALIPFVL
ncbi:MAG: methyltransferase family protein [Terriglobia bacterium]